MTTPRRRMLVEQLSERNPAPERSRWTVNEEALARSITVVDPFAEFLRRARRARRAKPAHGGVPVSEAQASESARRFVKRNADLLGLPRHVVPGLSERARVVAPNDHADAVWAVRFEAAFASKGYEAFKEVDNVADIEVFVADDGEVSSFVNLSRVHPHLTIDTKPALPQDDPRVIGKLVGRRVFAIVSAAETELDRLGELRRIPLGEVRQEDVTRTQLIIHVSTGPELAWATYRLGYSVEVAKPVPALAAAEGVHGDVPAYFFFHYVVDADTGDVLEDARAPLAAPPER
ncbi:MAG TPA: hypothetical protein VM580_08555 [Labilithrix sp.]|nr:hypothetical protein [Labilithrix sp.]